MGWQDAPIVQDSPPQIAAWKDAPVVEEQAQQKKPIPTRMQKVIGGAGEALLQGGPVGMLVRGASEGLSAADEAITKGAYSAGGKVTDIAASAGASPEVAAGLGTAANVGIQAAPMVLGGELAKGASPAFQAGAKDLMQSALKPTLKALKTGQAAKAIDTLLEEGINATKGGVGKLKARITELNDQIGEAIANSSATVNKSEVARALIGTLDKFKKQVNPNADMNAIKASWQQFMEHPLLTGVEEIPVKVAQDLKRGTYKQLSKKYGELGSADVEAQKNLARGLKEGIAEAVPEIQGLNAQESKLITALSVTERRALMDANKNPGGLAWLAHNPATWAMFMADKSALFKSLVARMMYSGSEQIPATAARAGIGAYEGIQSQP